MINLITCLQSWHSLNLNMNDQILYAGYINAHIYMCDEANLRVTNSPQDLGKYSQKKQAFMK